MRLQSTSKVSDDASLIKAKIRKESGHRGLITILTSGIKHTNDLVTRHASSVSVLQLLPLIALLLLSGFAPEAQEAPAPSSEVLKGVVWQPPQVSARAEEDLRRMVALGVEAVRVPASEVEEASFLPLADSLGLELFVDLPFAGLSGRALADSLSPESPWIEVLAGMADEHPSARHIGLAAWSDTGAERACRRMQAFAEEVRARSSADVRFYYSTLLAEGDRCSDAVDLVLLDARNADPAERLARWRLEHPDAPAGIAALGHQVLPESSDGLQHPYSPSSQARFFERHLDALLFEDDSVPALFIYRWRDAPEEPALLPPPGCCYGLLRADGEARAALDVVEGFFTDEETIFSFPAGPPPSPAPPWVILTGWLVIALLGGVYASSNLVRRLLPRYVTAPGFYRESVRQGRELPRTSTFVLAGLAALAGGTTGATLLTALARDDALLWLLSSLSAPVRRVAETLLGEGWLLILLLSILSALGIFLWASTIVLLSLRKRRLTLAQGLTLVLWPRWPILLLMIGGMLLTTVSPEEARTGALLLLAAWLLVFAVRSVRIARDVNRVLALERQLIALTLSPLTLLFALAAVAVALYSSEVMYLWRLLQEGF